MDEEERVEEIRKRLKQIAEEIEKLDQVVARLKEEIKNKDDPPESGDR